MCVQWMTLARADTLGHWAKIEATPAAIGTKEQAVPDDAPVDEIKIDAKEEDRLNKRSQVSRAFGVLFAEEPVLRCVQLSKVVQALIQEKTQGTYQRGGC